MSACLQHVHAARRHVYLFFFSVANYKNYTTLLRVVYHVSRNLVNEAIDGLQSVIDHLFVSCLARLSSMPKQRDTSYRKDIKTEVLYVCTHQRV
jgi:hypothetical protein